MDRALSLISNLRGRRATIAGALCLALTAVAVSTAEAQTITDHGSDLRVTPSSAGTYVARGTLPLGEGWKWTADCPFGLRRGSAVYPAQWWPVAWDRDGDVAVVELAAVVPGEPNLAADPDPIAFDVVRSDPPFAFAPPQLDLDLMLLVGTLGKLRLEVRDGYGNLYAGLISQLLGSPDFEIEVVGRTKIVVHTKSDMFLVQPVDSAAPKQLGAIHAWITASSNSPVIELDLRWHNSVVGDPDEMNPNILFDSAELVMPLGWRATSRWPLPTAGAAYEIDQPNRKKSVLPMVTKGSTPHLLRQRGHLTWRFVVHQKDVAPGLVQDAIDRRGWGTVRGIKGGWQDPFAKSWLAQRTLLPDLTAWEDAMESELSLARDDIEAAFASGSPYYYAPDGVGQMGPYHSIGVKYGGMTSGSEIFQTPGADLMWTAEPDGLFKYEALHRMVHDRQYGWFYDGDGNLVTAFHLIDSDNSLPIKIFSNEFIDIANKGALGFEHVHDLYAALQPRPAYEDDLVGTDPYNGLEQYDTQHVIRGTYPSKVLVWGANDRMARHDLIAQAAMCHMEQHDGPGGRLWGIYQWSQQHPGVAGEFGRGEAWAVDAVAHWYALASPVHRTLLDGWFQTVYETLGNLRTPLGVFYGNRDGKITSYYAFDDKYAIIQWFEHAILLHSIACMLESWAPDTQTETDLARWLVEGALAFWRYGWKPGTVGTYDQQAVAWMDPTLPAFASLQEIPADGFGGGPDSDQIASPMGVAVPYATLAEALELLAASQALTGTSNPLVGFESLYTYYLGIENRAPLVAWLQVTLE